MVVIELRKEEKGKEKKEKEKKDIIGDGNSISNINSSTDNSIITSMLKGDPVTAEQLSNYTVEEILLLYKHRGIAVECCQCGYKYVDKKERDLWTFDYSICPKCMGFNSFREYIFHDGNGNGSRRRRKVLISRIFSSADELIRFLNSKRYDFPDAISVSVTLKFSSKEEALHYLARAAYSKEIDAVIEG